MSEVNVAHSKKKHTLRISKKDLLKLLTDNDHMRKQITELQTRGTELVTENRELKKKIEDLNIQIDIVKSQLQTERLEPQNFNPPIDLFDPNIYMDGSNRY